MYKLLLCWRYLRTRYIALASIISVTLGVATMIVVNAVMAGFSHEMEDRMHNILSDVVLEGHGLENIEDPQMVMENIRHVAGPWIAGMTPTVHVPAILSFLASGQKHEQQIMLIGIDETTYASVSDCSPFLQHPENRQQLSWKLRDGGYDVHDHQMGDKSPLRIGMELAGWKWRAMWADRQKEYNMIQPQELGTGPPPPETNVPEPEHTPQPEQAMKPDHAAQANATPVNSPGTPESSGQAAVKKPVDPFAANPFPDQPFVPLDPSKQQYTGAVVGIEMASVRDHDGNDRFLILPGSDVTITTATAGDHIKQQSWTFTVVDF
jgi:lipoprotein-releasing system permease protein